MASFFGFILCFIVFAGFARAQVQSQGSNEGGGVGQQVGQPNSQGVLGPPSVRGSSGGGAVRVVPSVSISERYDSNVLFSPQKLSDYVTQFRPSARLDYQDDFVAGGLTGGITSEVYARNPELNFVGFNGALDANLGSLASRMVRGLGLQVTDTVMYTPQPPAFVMPEALPTSFIRGIQAARNNSLTNTGSIIGAYAVSPVAQLNATYSHQMLKFFDDSTSGVTNSLFNTTLQSFTVGPDYSVTRTQSIGASYQYQHMAFEPSRGTGMSLVQVIHGAFVTLKSSPSRELTAELAPGIAVVTGNSEKPQWTARALVRWSNGVTDAQLTYTRGLFPSFFVGAATLVSDNVSLVISQSLSSQWRVAAQTDYALNRSVGQANLPSGQANLFFESFGETISVSCTIWPETVASASVTYNHFSYIAGITEIQFPRQTAMFSLTKRWN